MPHYNSTELVMLLRKSYIGDTRCRNALLHVDVPCAISSDYKQLIFAGTKKLTFTTDGYMKIQNITPTIYDNSIQSLEIILSDEEGVVCSWVPVPNEFKILSIVLEEKYIVITAESGHQIKTTTEHLLKTLIPLTREHKGIDPQLLKATFYNSNQETVASTPIASDSSSTAPSHTKPILDNNPLGILTLDEKATQYIMDYTIFDFHFKLSINTSDSEAATEHLPRVYRIIRNIIRQHERGLTYIKKKLVSSKSSLEIQSIKLPCDIDEFMDTLSLHTMAFETDGRYHLFYQTHLAGFPYRFHINMNKNGTCKELLLDEVE